jgi:2,3-bisphosphoglycerate-independent phosphoglycerate mutase
VTRNGPFLLIILDGWGTAPPSPHNAITLARTPTLDRLYARFGHTLIQGSEHFVGLPDGQMGNSEVGHMNLGAGRIVYQEIMRISTSIQSGAFFRNKTLAEALDLAADGSGRKLHLLGLLSDGGVHSHQEHLYALIRMAKQRGVRELFVHPVLDGRDTPPNSGRGYLASLLDVLEREGTGRVATLSGRYYAMDRDKRWDRTCRAYDAYTLGEASRATDPIRAVSDSYERGVMDEFVEPVVLEEDGRPLALIGNGDVVIFFNFRADRARQITRALTEPGFDGFERRKRPSGLQFVCMTQYDQEFDLPVVFPPQQLVHFSGELIDERGLAQLRIAETEKYAHVTYFFNGGREDPFAHEQRILVPSPRVATYDLKPEMSALELTDKLVAAISSGEFGFIVVNYANGDMVGHTGMLDAAIVAVETVDTCLGRVTEAILDAGGFFFLTADHGNCEQMWDETTNQPHTAHTLNPVPFLLGHPDVQAELREDGILADVMPTALNLLGIPAASEMDGRDLRRDRH